MKRNFKLFVLVQESIKHFPIPLRKSLKVIAEGDFLVVFLFLLLLFLPKLNAEPTIPFFDPLKTVSMDFKDAGLKDILKALSIQSGLNFIAAQNVEDRTITLYLDRVPLKNAMDNLFKANNLDYELDKDSNTFIVKDWGKLEVETVTKVFALKYATVSSSSLKEEMANIKSAGGLATTEPVTEQTKATGTGKWKVEEDTGITIAVKKLLSEYGSVIEDFRTNSLIVTEIPSRMPIIEKVIVSLDVRVPQVMLEVEMLDVSKNVVDKMGIKFGQTPFTAVLTGASGIVGFPFHSWSTITDAGRGSLAINASPNTYTVTLDYLRTQTDTKYLARPRILTLNNETAEIKITTEETVGRQTTTTAAEGQSSQTTGVAERVTTGISLRVTPQINLETGEITMFVMPVVKDTSTSSFAVSDTSSTYFKDPEERSTKSTVRLKDGDTVIIGGLLRNDSSQTITKLPILGDIPVIGSLFRHKSKEKDRERELLVFITPHIVKDSIGDLAQAKKVTLPAREQSAASGVKRGLAINAGLNSFERKKK